MCLGESNEPLTRKNPEKLSDSLTFMDNVGRAVANNRGSRDTYFESSDAMCHVMHIFLSLAHSCT